MNDFLVHIKVFDCVRVHDVWIGENSIIQDFILDIVHSWFHGKFNYEHVCYHVEKDRILSSASTWADNEVLPGDHLILF
jgi:hypothetical protein